MTRFAGQSVLVTGGHGDIGRAVGNAFTAEGARVFPADVTGDDPVDVTDRDAFADWLNRNWGPGGAPDILVVNAGIVRPAGWQQVTAEDWHAQLNVNLAAAFFNAQTVANRMIQAETPGVIVFVGSWVGERIDAQILPYSVSKAGIRALTKGLATALAPHQIRVNEVAPGYVDAGLSGRIFEAKPEVRRHCTDRVPLRRLVTAEEVATQVLHLADPRLPSLTGTVVTLDGGLAL